VTADAKFDAWLAENQPIWQEFCRLADLMRAKRPNWSARAVLHVLRWNRALRDASDPLFKINNNWSARMARRYNSERGVDFFRERGE
jgi:hypothetical protein